MLGGEVTVGEAAPGGNIDLEGPDCSGDSQASSFRLMRWILAGFVEDGDMRVSTFGSLALVCEDPIPVWTGW